MLEGNHVYNYVSERLLKNGGSIEPYSIGVRDGGVQFKSPPLPYAGPLNRLVVLRDNAVMSNGGVFVSAGDSHTDISHCSVSVSYFRF